MLTFSPGRRCAAVVGLSFLALSSAGPLAAQGTMVHTLEAFHAPSAVLALGESRTLLVANTGRGEYGMIAGRGSISRTTLGADGRLSVEKLRFIEGLNCPIGLALLPTGSEALPAGTLVVAMGGTWMVDNAGKPLADDAARGTGLAFFDPQSGKALGRILLGRGSVAEKALGHAVTDPTGITVDGAGNLFLVDIDAVATRAARRADANAGLVRISRAALDALLRGETPEAGALQFAREDSLATGLVYSLVNDALIWGTFAGELRKVPRGDFSGRTTVETLSKRAGTVASLAMAPSGSILGAGADGSLILSRGSKVRTIKFRKEVRFLSSGQLAVVPGGEGKIYLILPEQGGGGVGPWRQRVNVIALPADI